MRWIGALLVFLGCGYFGFSMVAAHKKEERILQQIICAVDYMKCEMQYRLTPLPQLAKGAAKEICGVTGAVLSAFSSELENQISPDVSFCMEAVLRRQKDVPRYSESVLSMLGRCLGRFDLQGQLMELDSVRALCTRRLMEMQANRDTRLRSYQTLSLCAGAALAILLL